MDVSYYLLHFRLPLWLYLPSPISLDGGRMVAGFPVVCFPILLDPFLACRSMSLAIPFVDVEPGSPFVDSNMYHAFYPWPTVNPPILFDTKASSTYSRHSILDTNIHRSDSTWLSSLSYHFLDQKAKEAQSIRTQPVQSTSATPIQVRLPAFRLPIRTPL